MNSPDPQQANTGPTAATPQRLPGWAWALLVTPVLAAAATTAPHLLAITPDTSTSAEMRTWTWVWLAVLTVAGTALIRRRPHARRTNRSNNRPGAQAMRPAGSVLLAAVCVTAAAGALTCVAVGAHLAADETRTALLERYPTITRFGALGIEASTWELDGITHTCDSTAATAGDPTPQLTCTTTP